MKTKTNTLRGRFNPLNDYLFYKVFGEKGDEVQLLGFLNAVIGRTGKNRFTSVEILENKTLTPKVIGDKGSILDVRAVLRGGTRVNVEVQLRNRGNMDKRSLYYWSREYAAGIDKGRDYLELPDVIAVNIVDFDFPPSRRYHTRFHLREDLERDTVLTDSLEIHFINMVKYRKLKEKDIRNDPLCRWLVWFNKNSPPEQIAEVVEMDEAIQAADERMVYVTGDKEAIRAYEMRMMALSDLTSERNYAVRTGLEKGFKKGMKKGMKEGMEKGMEMGMEKGIERGMERGMEYVARNALAEGASIELIQKITGLSPEVIEKL